MIDSFQDLETFSEVPLKDGTHAYAEKSEIMLWPYAVGDGPTSLWDLTVNPKMPSDLEDILADRDILIWFHNVMFDGTVIRYCRPSLWKLLTEQKRFRCTLAQALTHGMPGGLDVLGDILGLPRDQRKNKDGKALIQLFCKPQPMGKPRATRHTHPERWEQFKTYAVDDIAPMRAIHKKLPMWNYSGPELDLWHLDAKINNRGALMDTDFAAAAIQAVARAQAKLSRQTVELTDGEVQKTTQRDKLLKFLLARFGVDLPDLKKSTLERRIDDPDLPVALRMLLANRLQASSSSTSKYKTIVHGVSSDQRARGLLQFAGAQRTKRWAGRLVQPQNMLRPKIGDLHDDELQAEIDFGIEAIRHGVEEIFYD
jgi:DNA polymerase